MSTSDAYVSVRAALAIGLLVVRDPRAVLRRIKRNEALELAAARPAQEHELRALISPEHAVRHALGEMED